MGAKVSWSMVALVAIVCAAVTVLLIFGVEVTSVIAALSIAGNVVQIMVYGKLQKVEDNTNGSLAAQQSLIRNLVEHAKNTVPIEAVAIKKVEETGV